MTACSAVDPVDQGKITEFVTTKSADLYVYGPSQPGRPVPLPPRQFVTLVRKESGYSIVRLTDGLTGWVDSSFLRPAPPLAPAVSEEVLFPVLIPLPPEPDFSLPVPDVPSTTAMKTVHQSYD